MPFAARIGDEVGSSSHKIDGPCSTNVTIDNKFASIAGDLVTSPTHTLVPTLVPTVKINNKVVCVIGDIDSNGDAITGGSTTVKFGS